MKEILIYCLLVIIILGYFYFDNVIKELRWLKDDIELINDRIDNNWLLELTQSQAIDRNTYLINAIINALDEEE